MQLASLLINGVEKITKTLVRDFEISFETGDRMGTARMVVLYDPITETNIFPGATVDIFSTSPEDTSGLWGAEIFGQSLFGSGTASVPIFSGTITNIEHQMMVARRVVNEGLSLWGQPEFGSPMFGEGTNYERVNVARIECRDWNSILENGIVPLGTAGFTSKTDAYIINSLFSTVAPTVGLSQVSSTTTLSTFDQVEGQSLRSILQRLSELTGAVYFIDPSKNLYWFLPASRPAAWGFSENPDNVTTFPFDRDTFRYTQEWRTPANKVNVLGAVSTGGARVSATRSDATSIATYGVRERTISDRTITSTGAAQARADQELASYANPQRSGVLTTRKSGLGVGQLVPINVTETLQFSGNFVIRRIVARWWSRSITNFEIEWGSYLPDIARALRAIYDQANQGQPNSVQPTTPATESVTNNSISDNSISGVKIMDATIENAKISNLNADKLTAGNVTVGGVGTPGSLVVKDGSGGDIGSIGGTTAGGWLKALAVGGSGISAAKFVVGASGALAMELDSGDSIVISGSSFDVTINNDGVKVISGSLYSHLSDDFVGSFGGSGNAYLKADGLYVNGTQIAGTQRTGWNSPSGSDNRAGWDSSTASLVTVADAVRTIIIDLKAMGIFGA